MRLFLKKLSFNNSCRENTFIEDEKHIILHCPLYLHLINSYTQKEINKRKTIQRRGTG